MWVLAVVKGRRLLYSTLFAALVPAALGHLLWRGRAEPAYRRDLAQRFGYLPAGLPAAPLWIHAASVGEVRAVEPLLDGLLARHPDVPLVVTTYTPTGRAQLRARFGGRVAHAYLPFDLPGAVNRFLTRLRPRLGVILELELWPNLLAACRAAELPLVLANARLSERSFARYRRFPGLFGQALATCDVLAVQTEADAERLRRLGAPPQRIVVNGSIKFDQAVPPALVAEGRKLRARLAPDRPVWIAASTHEGEEQAVLAAHRSVRVHFPGALLILVPRHPARFPRAVEFVADAGFTAARRSAPAETDPAADVLIGDTMGEMMLYLAAADAAFMGGSLVPVGGHNPLEPAALGLPVISGPQVFNFEHIDTLLGHAGGRLRVTDAESLAQALIRLLAEPDYRANAGRAAESVIAVNRGACERLLALIEARLEYGRR